MKGLIKTDLAVVMNNNNVNSWLIILASMTIT